MLRRPLSGRPLSRRSLTAVWAACLGFFFLCAGTPGLEAVGTKHRTEKGRAQLHRKLGTPMAAISIGAGQLNDHVRLPVARLFRPFQRAFGLDQSWDLYGGVQKRIHRLVIEVDDRVVYRTNDPTADWLAGPLAQRRMRAVADTVVSHRSAQQWDHFAAFVVHRARTDFPNARTVDVMAEYQLRGDHQEPWRNHGRRLQAPDWIPLVLGRDGALDADTP